MRVNTEDTGIDRTVTHKGVKDRASKMIRKNKDSGSDNTRPESCLQ